MFDLQNHLDNDSSETESRFSFTATTPHEFTQWQARFRVELAQVLGIAQRWPTAVPRPDLLSTTDKGSYREEKYHVHLGDVVIPMYLLIPKRPPPYKTILAFHGHGMGVHQILGNYPDDETAKDMIAHDENFAQRLAEDGFLVCAIEQRGFGERITEQISEAGNSCRHLAMHYLMHGKTLIGERIGDAVSVTNYLITRDDIVPDYLGCTGHSGGGMTALFLGALDTRFNVNVVSGYFCDYQHSILAMPHCPCNYVPNLLSLAGIGTLATLIAPRRLRFINGENDALFPIAGFHKPISIVQCAYSLLDVHESLSVVKHTNGHQYLYDAGLEWFQ